MDERMRRLGREAAQGDTEAAARQLRERIRIEGKSFEGRVRLAAHLGEERARLALGEGEQVEQSEIETGENLRDWVQEIANNANLEEGEKKLALMRAAIAATRRVLSVLGESGADDTRLNDGLTSVERFILASPEGNSDLVDDVVSSAEGVVLAVSDADEISLPVAEAIDNVLISVVADDPDFLTIPFNESINRAISAASRAAEPRVLQKAIQDELIPWALGEGDPVRERVEKLQKEQEG